MIDDGWMDGWKEWMYYSDNPKKRSNMKRLLRPKLSVSSPPCIRNEHRGNKWLREMGGAYHSWRDLSFGRMA